MTITIIICAALILLYAQRRYWQRHCDIYRSEVSKYVYLWNEASNKNHQWLSAATMGLYIIRMDCNCERKTIRVVAGHPTNNEVYFVIKSFSYNPDDVEDYNFAIREAEELIEKINEA